MISEDELSARAEAFLKEYVYGFIFHDISAAISGKANYLAALGLVAYTEFMGGLRDGSLGTSGHSKERFYSFFDTLGPEYAKVRRRREVIKVYSNIRCGLAHEYFISQESVVKLSKDKEFGQECGIEVHPTGVVYFIVERYWDDFQRAVDAYRDALVTERNPQLLANFGKSVVDQWHFTQLNLGDTLPTL